MWQNGQCHAEGWLADPTLKAQFTIIELNAEHLGWAGRQQVAIYSDCDAAIGWSASESVMVLAVKPQVMDEAIAALAHYAMIKLPF